MKGVKWLIFQKKILFICLFLPVLSAFLVFALFSSSASATSINSITSGTMTFDIQNPCAYDPLYVCHDFHRMSSLGNSIPQVLVSYNSQRSRTTVYGLGVEFTPAGGNSTKYYNKYRFGITLRQALSPSNVPTLIRNLGKYAVSMDGVTRSGSAVHTDVCGYEIADDQSYISHICYFNLENYETLSSATFSLGDHSAQVPDPSIGYVSSNYVVNVSGNTNDLRLTDITSVVQASDDPMLSGQQELINNTNLINSNIVDLKNQNHEDLQAIKDAIENQSDSEKEQIQEASDDAEDEANDSGADSEAQGQTLVQIISGFISAISNPNGGSCIIDVDLSLYHGGTHNMVDLCHLDPPTGVTTVLSIILIVFVIRACVAVVQAMLALYREFQS